MLLWFQMLTQVTKALFRLSVQIWFFCIRFKCLTVYRIYSNTLFVPVARFHFTDYRHWFLWQWHLPMLNTTHNSNPVCNTDLALHCDNILLSHWIICILRGSSRNVGSWNVQIYSMLIILRWSQNSKRWVGQQYIVIFHLTCTSQQHSLVSAKTLSMFSTNHIMWCEEVTNKKATLNLIWMVRLERISR